MAGSSLAQQATSIVPHTYTAMKQQQQQPTGVSDATSPTGGLPSSRTPPKPFPPPPPLTNPPTHHPLPAQVLLRLCVGAYMFFAPSYWLHRAHGIVMPPSVALELYRQYGAATLIAGGSLHSALWSRNTNTMSLVSSTALLLPACVCVCSRRQEREGSSRGTRHPSFRAGAVSAADRLLGLLQYVPLSSAPRLVIEFTECWLGQGG